MMPSKTRGSGRRWALRFGMAAMLGVLCGAGGAVIAVVRLDPVRVTRAEKTRSKTVGTPASKPAAVWPDPDSAPANLPAEERAFGEEPLTTVAVPALIDLEEGEARAAIVDMGLQVGKVEFRSSTRPAGIVLATIPTAGTLVAVQTAVTLILSDGHGGAPDSSTVDDRSFDPRRTP